MGIYTMCAKAPGEVKESPKNRNLFTASLSTCALTIANPLTLVGLVGVTAASGIGMQHFNHTEIAFLVTGIFLGSSSWWLILSSSAEWLGRKLGPNLFHVLNLGAGAAIALFGLWQLLSLAHHVWKF
jgi:arginine exporter protein ArgO